MGRVRGVETRPQFGWGNRSRARQIQPKPPSWSDRDRMVGSRPGAGVPGQRPHSIKRKVTEIGESHSFVPKAGRSDEEQVALRPGFEAGHEAVGELDAAHHQDPRQRYERHQHRDGGRSDIDLVSASLADHPGQRHQRCRAEGGTRAVEAANVRATAVIKKHNLALSRTCLREKPVHP